MQRPLTRRQLEVARYMGEHPMARKKDIIAKYDLGKNTLTNWLKREDFCNEIDRTASALSRLSDNMPQLMEFAIQSGNAEAARLILQLNGMLPQQTEVRIHA